MLLALAGCGRSYLMQGERASWRHEAEETCLKSGAVKVGVVQVDPIEGPGMCGADFPLKVSALGEAPAMSYGDDLRPPAAIPNGSSADMPNWPPSEPRYAPPVRVAPVQSRRSRRAGAGRDAALGSGPARCRYSARGRRAGGPADVAQPGRRAGQLRAADHPAARAADDLSARRPANAERARRARDARRYSRRRRGAVRRQRGGAAAAHAAGL